MECNRSGKISKFQVKSSQICEIDGETNEISDEDKTGLERITQSFEDDTSQFIIKAEYLYTIRYLHPWIQLNTLKANIINKYSYLAILTNVVMIMLLMMIMTMLMTLIMVNSKKEEK